MMKRVHRTRRKLQRGQAIVLIAFAMIGLIAFLVLAIDGSKYLDQRRVTQNAADVSSLAGMYVYLSETGGGNNRAALSKILQIAETNGIPDTNPPASDGSHNPAPEDKVVNSNVEAYWIASDGKYVCSDGSTVAGTTEPPPTCAKLDTDATHKGGTGAKGIKVRVRLPYTTFLGQMLGQKDLRAQADGTALRLLGHSDTPPNSCGGICSVVTGGGDMCSTYDYPAFYWGSKPANNTDWGKGIFINGYMRIDKMPNSISTHNGTGKLISVYTPQNLYDSGSEQWPQTGGGGPEVPIPSGEAAGTYSNPYNFYGAGSSFASQPSYSFPDWAYLKPNDFGPNIPPATLSKSELQIQAWSFRPSLDQIKNGDVVDTPASTSPVINAAAQAVPSTSDGKNWIFRGIEENISNSDPDAPHTGFFHYINNGTSAAARTQNGSDFKNMVNAGLRGIFFIDGNIETDLVWPDGVTLIATGRVFLNMGGGAGSDGMLGNAGTFAYGISVLAGGTMSSIPPSDPNTACANPSGITDQYDTSKWILYVTANQLYWSGIAYVPNGLFNVDVNQHNTATPRNGPIIAWSEAHAVTGPATNYKFSNCDATCFPHPTYPMGLNQ